MGLQLFSPFWSRFGFLRRGRSRDVLNDSGTWAEDKERLNNLVMTGRSSSRVSFKSHVGIGSNLQCLDGSDLMSFLTSESDTRQNLESSWSYGAAEEVIAGTGTESVKEDTTLDTFSLKNLANLLASSLSDEWSGRMDDWFGDESDFTMLNRCLGLVSAHLSQSLPLCWRLCSLPSLKTYEDCVALQQDLRILEKWEKKWQVRFKPDKCNIMRFTRKSHPFHHSYTLSGHQL